MPPLVLFDIDLTLIHTSGAGRKALATVFKRLFDLDEPARDVSFEGRTDHAIFMEIMALNGLASGDIDAVLDRVIDAYIEELPRSIAANGGGRVLPGVPELLQALESRGVPFGLATGNIRRGAEAKLAHFGLWHRFPGGGFGDGSPVRADVVRQGIEEMAMLTGCDPEPAHTLVVGDTPLDIEAAHLAGAVALGVGTGSHGVEQLLAAGAEFALPDLSDTSRILEIVLEG